MATDLVIVLSSDWVASTATRAELGEDLQPRLQPQLVTSERCAQDQLPLLGGEPADRAFERRQVRQRQVLGPGPERGGDLQPPLAHHERARGLRRCFGMKTAVCTAFADNEVGRLLEDCILQGGVDTEFIRWLPYDGVGRSVRNGLNFTERGFGVRAAVGVPDRGNTAASQLKPGDFNWDDIFGKQGVRWFHTGGIFAALSDTTAALAEEAVQAAKKNGVMVSYDLNYRPSLWQSIGGQARAREVNRELAPLVDVMLGNEEDFTAALGFAGPGDIGYAMAVVVLAGIGMSTYSTSVRRAKEAVLLEDLFRMRDALDQYRADKGNYPPDLASLVAEGYLRNIPKE